MTDQLQKALKDADLISACVCGVIAAVIWNFLVSVPRPSLVHAVLALVALSGVLGAFLFIARAKVEPDIRAAAIGVTGAISLAVLWILAQIF